MAYKLGDLQSSEQLIKDLYIDLRKKVNLWADVTKQTPQARMGYVGQHLASVVTGYPGGKSGARGYDLIINKFPLAFGEIKTCYRVDQLGYCKDCGSAVSSIEKICSSCNSANVIRRDDSKWLITIKDESDLEKCFKPESYFFVLFEYEDIKNKDNLNIKASIWKVNSANIGFKYCLIDYFYNIKSTAPLNVWPYQLKFYLFKPVLIYRSIIMEDDTINTTVFPGMGEEQKVHFPEMLTFYHSDNLTDYALKSALKKLSGKTAVSTLSRRELMNRIEKLRECGLVNDEKLIDTLAECIYSPVIPNKYLID